MFSMYLYRSLVFNWIEYHFYFRLGGLILKIEYFHKDIFITKSLADFTFATYNGLLHIISYYFRDHNLRDNLKITYYNGEH